MGYQCLRSDYFNLEKGNLDDFGQGYPIRGATIQGEDIGGLTWNEIQELKTPFLMDAMSLYNRYKRFGLPHGKGWANERATVISALEIIDNEARLYDSWELDKGSSK